MSFEVYASSFKPLLDATLFSKLNHQFRLRHRVRHIKAVRYNRRLHCRPYGLDLIDNFVVASCHWDKKHMWDTADNIKFAVRKIGIEVGKVRASSQEISIRDIPEKGERYEGWEYAQEEKERGSRIVEEGGRRMVTKCYNCGLHSKDKEEEELVKDGWVGFSKRWVDGSELRSDDTPKSIAERVGLDWYCPYCAGFGYYVHFGLPQNMMGRMN